MRPHQKRIALKELAALNKYFYRYKHLFALGILFVALTNVFAIWPAQLVRHAFDMVADSVMLYPLFDGSSVQSAAYASVSYVILLYGVLIVLMAVFRGVLLFFMRQTLIVMSRYIEYDLKNDIYLHYQKLPVSFYRQNNTGDLMARISEDVGRVRMYVGPAIMYGINLVVSFVLVIAFMLTVNVKLTLYAIIPLPFLSVGIYYINNVINKRSEAIQKALSGMSTFVQEAFSGIRVIKAFAREEDSHHSFRDEANAYREKTLDLVRVESLFFPIMIGMIGCSIVLTVYIGGIQVMNGAITPGNIAEFIIYITMLTWPVTALGWITSITQRAAASQKRINEFLQNDTEITSERNLDTEIKGTLTFDNVSFTYQNTGTEALKNVSFTVQAGETIAILGGTGSGKSTLANLVCRLFDVSEGRILVDGEDIKDYSPSSLRSQIGYVPQDVFLFSETIHDNIAFGGDHSTKEEVIDAAKKADVYENIMDFPLQFDTILGERGITLSGGQKQRVSIARAIIRKPKLMIMDDSLSAVDTKTENAILNSLQEIMVDKTSIIISHRVSSAKLADKILILEDGQIVESGNHDSLIKSNGYYKELYEKQLRSGEEEAA